MTIQTPHRSPFGALALLLVSTLSGCWTAPVANVPPNGEPRLIQQGVTVESVEEHAIVQSVDGATRTITLHTQGQITATTVKAGPKVSDLDRIKSGDRVRARITQDLAIYVLRDGKAPGADGTLQPVTSDAKVLTVDRSYRLLTLQYPNGQNETFKVPLGTKLDQMQGGDDVVIRPVSAVSLRVR